MNNEQKLQVATDALKAILGDPEKGNLGLDRKYQISRNHAREALAILAAPSTEQQAATANGPGQDAAFEAYLNKWKRITHNCEIPSRDSFIAGWHACIAQAAPAGDAVEVLQVYRPGNGWHDVGVNEYIGTMSNNRRRLYAEPPVATERAATQPAGDVLYAVIYDDADMRPAIVIGEKAARAAFARIGGQGYNAHLFAKLESNSRDDPHYNANLTTSAPDLSAQQPAAASANGIGEDAQFMQLLKELRGCAADTLDSRKREIVARVSAWGAQQREAAEAKYEHLKLCALKEIEQANRVHAACKAAEKERDDLRAQLDEHKAARIAYANEFPLNADGEPDIGNVHANIRALKAQLARPADLAGHCERGGEGCVCGGDTPRVREGCGYWVEP